MSLLNVIKLGMRAFALWKQGKNVCSESEALKEKVEQVGHLASEVYEKAGRPDASQVGAALGKGAAHAFLKLKKMKNKFVNDEETGG